MTWFIIIILIFVFIAFLAFRKSLDKDNVKLWVESKGGRLISKEWTPFGSGWAGESRERLYTIIYIDRLGNRRKAEIKTSYGTGVYVRKDEIISPSNKSVNSNNSSPFSQKKENKNLAEENRLLKEELDKLKKKKSS